MSTYEYNKSKGWYADNDKPYKITWFDVASIVHVIVVPIFWIWFVYNYY